jgi:hypothetical protein
MSESTPGFIEEEPSAEQAAIPMSEVLERLSGLQGKLSEFQSDAADLGPEGLTTSARLQHSILEVLVETAIEEPSRPLIYLHEVALAVQERTGMNVVRASTIPFIPRRDAPGYLPDFARLASEAGPEDVAFSAAYMTVRSYCDGSYPLEADKG